MTISSALKWASLTLKKSADHKDSAALDAEILLAHTLRLTREILFTHPEEKIKLSNLTKFKKLVKRRAAHAPIAYIIGEKEFFGLTFKVNKHVLIPRPETEMLVEEALLRYRVKSLGFRIIDVGTGSGAIAVCLAKYLSGAQIIATDISGAALQVAKQNAHRHGVTKKIKFLKKDLVPSNLKAQTSYLITANLPYLSERAYRTTSPEIKKYEPKSAFIGGGLDGLNIIRALLLQIKKQRLRGMALLEIDPSQKTKLFSFVKKNFPNATFEIKKDLAGRDRLANLEII